MNHSNLVCHSVFMLIISILFYSCQDSEQSSTTLPPLSVDQKAKRDSIVQKYLYEEAGKYPLYSNERQKLLDAGLSKDSTISYLWQQKAMPLFKQGKYEVGMKYLDKAVKFDRNNEWLEYRAFMKCIFSKRYRDAIEDFEKCKAINGNSFVMDHSYNTYIGMSRIMLNEYKEAESLLLQEVAMQEKQFGKENVHQLVLFYLGIAQLEQDKLQEAIANFDRCIDIASTFPEPYYYKSQAQRKLGETDEANNLLGQAIRLGQDGNSFSEDNAIYERYPYQVRWTQYRIK